MPVDSLPAWITLVVGRRPQFRQGAAMKSKLLGPLVALGLCALGGSVHATTIELPLNGLTIIGGPFANYPENTIEVDLSFQYTGGDYIGLTPPDPIYGPFYAYFISIFIEDSGGGSFGACYDNQAASLCERVVPPNDPITYVYASGRNRGSIDTSSDIRTYGDVTPVNAFLYAELPDGLLRRANPPNPSSLRHRPRHDGFVWLEQEAEAAASGARRVTPTCLPILDRAGRREAEEYGLKRLYLVMSVTVMAPEFGQYEPAGYLWRMCHESILSWYRLRNWNGSRHSGVCRPQ